MTKKTSTVKADHNTRPIKRLVIDMTSSRPEFDFTGIWAGRDIITVTRLMQRAYFSHQREIRRSALAESKSKPTSTMEVTTHA